MEGVPYIEKELVEKKKVYVVNIAQETHEKLREIKRVLGEKNLGEIVKRLVEQEVERIARRD